MCILIFYLKFRILNKCKTMKVDGKVQSLLLADPEEFEKVFMPGLGNKLFYMYSNNVFSLASCLYCFLSCCLFLHVF